MNRTGMIAIAGAGVLLLAAVLVGTSGGGGSTATLTGLVIAVGAGLGVIWSRQRGFESERERLEALVLRTDEQLRVGEKLTAQADSLPMAVEALSGISERIASLETSWASAHRDATQETLSVVQDAILSFRADAKQAIEDAARVAKEAVMPLVEGVVESTVGAGREVIAEHTARLEEVERAQAARADELERNQAARADEFERAQATRAEALELTQASRAEELELAQAARAEALVAQLGDAVLALRDVGAEQAASISSYAQDAEARLIRHENEQAATLSDWVQTLDEAQRAQTEQRAELEARLVEAGSVAVEGMRGQLETHAASLAEELRLAGGVVSEAANLAQAGGAELSAVAEMFAAAVERQSEGAKAWLDSLTEVEHAVEMAGRGAAADALSGQLAETKGVFARQLEFQRALFEQVRDLRDEVSALRPEAQAAAPEASEVETAEEDVEAPDADVAAPEVREEDERTPVAEAAGDGMSETTSPGA
jgi:hypothetical protein